MKRTIITTLTAALLLGVAAHACGSDWGNFIVRTSGLGWSDGYHAYDQCPPRKHGHFPVRHPATYPGAGAAQESHAPYYFEDPGYKAEAAQEAGELLPPADAKATNSRVPGPQARHQPRSRYFQAVQSEQQSQLQQARR